MEGSGNIREIADASAEEDNPVIRRTYERVGRMLGEKWHLDKVLGFGGMAAVYAATHRNGSRAAVKILHPELAVDPGFCKRFFREGRIANAVGHDGAVKVIDDDTTPDGVVYLVTELLDGETLEERRKRLGGTLSEDDVLSIADQLLDVLASAHANGIVHRDLKPENLFLTRASQIKVLDFGIARARALSTATQATTPGAIMGTPAFMAPEQARGIGEEVDARTDIWACGAIMFTLLTGRNVHEGRSVSEVLVQAMTQPAPSLASVAAHVAPAVTRVVDRALAFDKAARWSDARAMELAVRDAYAERHGGPIAAAPKPAVPDSVPDRTLPQHGAGAAPPSVSRAMTSVAIPSAPAGLSAAPSSRWRILGAALVMVICGAVALATSQLRATGGPVSASIPSASIRPSSQPPSADPGPISAEPPSTASAASVAPEPSPSTSARVETASARPPPRRPPPAASAKPNCNPPYVLDPATGVKNWKIECL